jgi:hypothetical protein
MMAVFEQSLRMIKGTGKMIFGVFTQPSDMWMTNIKTAFFTKGILEGFDVIYEILGM